MNTINSVGQVVDLYKEIMVNNPPFVLKANRIYFKGSGIDQDVPAMPGAPKEIQDLLLTIYVDNMNFGYAMAAHEALTAE